MVPNFFKRANSNKSRKRGKKEEAKLRKHIASIVAEERQKNDDSDPGALLAFVKRVTASNTIGLMSCDSNYPRVQV